MSPASIAVLAFGMSVDAFAAALARGASGRRVHLGHALRTGMVFGLVEAATPVIGWAAGILAAGYIAAVDHWVAFGLLGLVGGRMILGAVRGHGDGGEAGGRSPLMLVCTALGTSIDAMVVGVSLAFLQIDIWLIAAATGLATFCMATGGMLAGRMLGARFGRWAEAAGGAALVVLGAAILYEHLAA